MGDDPWPFEVFVESLVLVGFQAAVAGGFAAPMVEMFEGASGKQMELFGNAPEVSASPEAGVYEREGDLATSRLFPARVPWPSSSSSISGPSSI